MLSIYNVVGTIFYAVSIYYTRVNTKVEKMHLMDYTRDLD
jgi:hypothetical protein